MSASCLSAIVAPGASLATMAMSCPRLFLFILTARRLMVGAGGGAGWGAGQRGRFDGAPHAEKKGESDIVREVAGPIGFFLFQGAAPGALTVAMPGVQPTAQEKEPELRAEGLKLRRYLDQRSCGRNAGGQRVATLWAF